MFQSHVHAMIMCILKFKLQWVANLIKIEWHLVFDTCYNEMCLLKPTHFNLDVLNIL